MGSLGESRVIPIQICAGLTLRQLSFAETQACGLDTCGAAWCWGDSEKRQMGNATMGGIYRTPVPVTGGLTFTSLAVGFIHTCGLDRAGVTWCWGANDAAQLGDGSTDPQRAKPAGPVIGGRVLTSLLAAG